MTLYKKKRVHGDDAVQLNIMPFIDIFSLLCTFLLFTAVFASIGIHNVQIPFFSNVPQPAKQEKKPTEIELKLEIEPDHMTLRIQSSSQGVGSENVLFELNDIGMKMLQTKLIFLKERSPSSEKLTVFVNETIKYEALIKVLDSVRVIHATETQDQKTLFPKVILGDVIL
jgi:biopolymer transport protein ExbD